MACDSAMPAPAAPLPRGYAVAVTTDGAALAAAVTTADRAVVAPRRARAPHRPADARQVLTATADGRALYAIFGWTILAPWSTAEREAG